MDDAHRNLASLVAPALVAGLALAVAGGCAALVGSAEDGFGGGLAWMATFIYGVPLVGWLVALFVLLAEGRSRMIVPAMTTGAALGIIGAVGTAMAAGNATPALGTLSLAMLTVCGVGLFVVLRPPSVMIRSVLADRLERSRVLNVGEPGVAAVLMGALLAVCALAVYNLGVQTTRDAQVRGDNPRATAAAEPHFTSAPPYIPPTPLDEVRADPLTAEAARQVLGDSGLAAAGTITTSTAGLVVNIPSARFEDTSGPVEIVFDPAALRQVVDRVRIAVGEYSFAGCEYYARPAPGMLVIGRPPAGCPPFDDPPWAPARDISAALGLG